MPFRPGSAAPFTWRRPLRPKRAGSVESARAAAGCRAPTRPAASLGSWPTQHMRPACTQMIQPYGSRCNRSGAANGVVDALMGRWLVAVALGK